MEVKITLESKVAASNLLRSLHSQYQLGHLCDVTVQAGQEDRRGSFHAHRAVLAACSAYFQKVFIVQEPVRARQAAVFLQDISSEDFQAFTEFAYTASVKVTRAQLPRLLQVATRLECRDLEEACRVTGVTSPLETPPDPTAPPPEGPISNPEPGKCKTLESNGGMTGMPSQESRGESAANQNQAGANAAVALATKVVIRRMRFLPMDGGAEGGGGAQAEAFRCEECGGAEFRSLRLFQAHARREHRAQLVVKYACDLCPQLVATRQNLQQHRATVHRSERAFACGVCGKRFKRPKDVSDHTRRVHGRRTPQQCPHCGRLVTSKAGLALHLRTHTGEKPYRCAHCGARFAQKSSYNTHTRIIHLGAKGRQSGSPAHWRQSCSRTDLRSAEAPRPMAEEGGGQWRGRDQHTPMDEGGDVRAVGGGLEGEELGTGPGTVVHAGKGTTDQETRQDHHGDKEEEEEGREEEKEGEEADCVRGMECDNKDGICSVHARGAAGKASACRYRAESWGGSETGRGMGRGTGQGSEGKHAAEASGRGGGALRCALARRCRTARGGEPREKPFRCETCGRGLGSARAWQEHRDCVHSDERRFACSACGGTFKRQRDVRTHYARTHEGHVPRPLCSVCGKILSSRSALVFHMRTHTGEKPYHCAICNQRFRQPSQLKTHTRGHTGEKPYICEVCGASFRDSGKLTTHRRTHTGERLFQCDVCEKSFTSKEYLKHHKLRHLGATPFHCEQCGKSFGLRASYLQHCRVHSDTRPFFCELCGKSFTQQGALRRHQRIHTGEKPFKCKACGRAFTDMSVLRRHVAVHDRKAEWRTYVIDLTNKRDHNWSKIKVFGIGREDGCHAVAVSSLSAPVAQGPEQRNDQSQPQL